MRFDLDDKTLTLVVGGLLLVTVCGVGLPSYFRMQRYKNMPPAIASVKVGNRIFRVAEWVEQRPNYTSFKTTDGALVEIVENEVKVR
jgi:hypothetical protein